MKHLVVLLAGAGLLSLAGCGGGDEQTTREAMEDAGVTESEDQVRMSFDGPDGEGSLVIGDMSKVNLPAYAPLYPKAEIASSMAGMNGQGSGAMVTMTTSDKMDEVHDFYRDAFKKAGLTIQADTTTPDMRMLVAVPEGGAEGKEGVSVTIMSEGAEGTRITMIAGQG